LEKITDPFVAKFGADFWIAGFGLGESIEERCSLLNAVTVRKKSFLYQISKCIDDDLLGYA